MENSITAKDETRLGAYYVKSTESVDFRLFSQNATDVILCIFEAPQGEDAIMNFTMTKAPGSDIWHTNVKTYALGGLEKPIFYGFRVFGPNWPKEEGFEPGSSIGFKEIIDKEGNRFNPNKIAYDPYTRELSHMPDISCYRVNESNFTEDNARCAAKSVFLLNEDVEITMPEPRALVDEIIGEAHIKDLTALSTLEGAGTFKGAENFAKSLKNMGFTMIEFLPLNEFDPKDNHWGYMPLGYFSLSRRYAAGKEFGSALNEFRALIDTFHKNGLKVCMDVVFNHTGEGRIYDGNVKDANLMSYALIDNKTYYKLREDNTYCENSCCKNDLNTPNAPVQSLILDTVEYWARQGVDAFRFDLAAVLMDVNKGSQPNYSRYGSFANEIAHELEERGIKVNAPDECERGINLIAEPWMCTGANAYQLGNFPYNWAEWNDVARNTIRANTARVHSTDPLGLRNLIEGTPFVFNYDARAINYIASHDGFTLNDLNSYDKKDPSTQDGDDWEICSSHKGDKDAQENAIKKQILLLMLSKGTPMLQVGDIVSHSKGGNNNSYNLDNEVNYIDFLLSNDDTTREGRVFDFITSIIEFRKQHNILRTSNHDIGLEFYDFNGNIIDENDTNYWQNTNSNLFIFKTTGEDVVLAAFSKDDCQTNIKLPENSKNKVWHFVCDTSAKDSPNIEGVAYIQEYYTLNPHAAAVFVEK